MLAPALLAIPACSYPEFEFRAGGDAHDDVVFETTSEETSVLDSSTEDALDSMVAETTEADTATTDVAPEVAPSAGCSGVTAFFCDDFDSVTSPADNWGGSAEAGGGSISLLSTGAYSPPNAVLSQIPTGSAMVTIGNMGKTVNAPTATAKTRFDMRIFFESPSYGGDAVSVIKIQRGGGHGVGLVAKATGVFVEVYGDAYTLYPTAGIPSGKWVHLRLDCTLRTTGGTYQLFVDDMTKPLAEGSGLSTVDVEGVDRSMIVGLYTDLPSVAYRVRYDDVIIDFP